MAVVVAGESGGTATAATAAEEAAVGEAWRCVASRAAVKAAGEKTVEELVTGGDAVDSSGNGGGIGEIGRAVKKGRGKEEGGGFENEEGEEQSTSMSEHTNEHMMMRVNPVMWETVKARGGLRREEVELLQLRTGCESGLSSDMGGGGGRGEKGQGESHNKEVLTSHRQQRCYCDPFVTILGSPHPSSPPPSISSPAPALKLGSSLMEERNGEEELSRRIKADWKATEALKRQAAVEERQRKKKAKAERKQSKQQKAGGGRGGKCGGAEGRV
jgi:hypothetical protein